MDMLHVVSTSSDDIRESAILSWLKRHLRVTPELHGNAFLVRQPAPGGGKALLYVTPLFLALCMVELTDIVFAVDSVPAIFAITSDPFIVYTSNIFAVLVFIGSKIFLGDFVFGGKVPASLSLAVTGLLIASGILYSLWKTRKTPPPALG